jgi:hypothetical protein
MTNTCALSGSGEGFCILFYAMHVGSSALCKLLMENRACICHVGVFDTGRVTKPSHVRRCISSRPRFRQQTRGADF